MNPGMLLVVCLVAASVASLAATEDLGQGFLHHGVATPVSNHRGTVATVDGQGRDVVLVWLFDHSGGYALLLIDAETGQSETFKMPFASGGDCPYSSILSSRGKFYTHFGSHFCEFDPAQRKFTFEHATAPQMAMSMTEDDHGVIWSVTYPQSGVVSFNPATREFKDYGHVHAENWAQYQRSTAADDTGWIYFGLGNTASQIIAFDPTTGQGRPVLPEAERARGSATVIRDVNGKVYGTSGGTPAHWYELHNGLAQKLSEPPTVKAKPYITSHQGLFHRQFPSGRVLQTCDLTDRVMVTADPKTKKTVTVKFDYASEGAHIMGVAAAPDGTICGGTAFPMRFFSYNPRTDAWVNREAYGQWNTVAKQGDHFFAGGYGGGFLLDWNPAQPWVATVKGKAGCNPLFLTQSEPTINRPHRLLAHPDGHTLVLAGTPQYGYTGGGLLFWDRATGQHQILEHTAILPDQSTVSLVAVLDGKLLGGSTTEAGTGGEKKAKQAELYLMDLATKKVEWHEPVFPGAQTYTDLYRRADGLVYGVADQRKFFVFDPAKRTVVYSHDTGDLGPTTSQQGPRVIIETPGPTVYLLFVKGLVKVDPATYELKMVATSPVSIGPGGDYLDGRIYFGSGSHVYSWKVPDQ